jgi:hypothetical protein
MHMQRCLRAHIAMLCKCNSPLLVLVCCTLRPDSRLVVGNTLHKPLSYVAPISVLCRRRFQCLQGMVLYTVLVPALQRWLQLECVAMMICTLLLQLGQSDALCFAVYPRSLLWMLCVNAVCGTAGILQSRHPWGLQACVVLSVTLVNKGASIERTWLWQIPPDISLFRERALCSTVC